jgi:predicted Rossmann-fold nucleotide-binding protein
MKKYPIIGVLCGAREVKDKDVQSRCEEVGSLLAELGLHLLTGGGTGAMHIVCRAFVESPKRLPTGHAIGIIPAKSDDEPTIPKDKYPNPYIEIPIYTHLASREGKSLFSRNHLNVLTPDAIIALDGGDGTDCEVALVEDYSRIGRAISYATSASRHKALKWAKDKNELIDFLRNTVTIPTQ